LGNLTKIVFVLAVILIFPIIIHQAFAYTIAYEPIGYKLKQNPTICAIEPSDPNLSYKEIEKLFDQTRIAVSEWEVQLQQAVLYQQNKDYWEIDYVQIEKDQTDAASNCDIKIFFEPKPAIPVLEHYALGLAEFDPISDTWIVTIYYLEVKLEYTTEIVGGTRYYWYEPYYTENLRTNQEFGTTIRHEVGHALGLGHYTADDVSVSLEWSKGKKPAPSIMIPFHAEVSDEQKIVPLDIDKLRSIYGENGFTTFSNVDEFESYKAQMLIEKDYFEDALSYTEKYLKSNPSDEELLYYKGETLWGLDRYSDAGTIMDKVLAINPENEGALYTKGKSLAKSKKYDEAIEFLDKVLAINPQHDKALSYKGLIFKKQEMYDEAGAYDDKALAVNPFNTSTLNRAGDLLSIAGRYEEAIFYYDQALEIEPDKTSALYNKANALFDLERFKAAIEYYDKVLEIDPNDYDALYNKGAALENLGRIDVAKIYFDKAEKLESSITPQPQDKIPTVMEKPQIPIWIKNGAGWWADGLIGDADFVSGIQYLIKENIMVIPDLPEEVTQMELKDEKRAMGMKREQNVPDWIRNNAGWWADGLISDDDFVSGIKYLVEQGIIKV